MSSPATQKTIEVANLSVANHLPFVLFGGMNVLESKQMAMDIAGHYVEVCSQLDIPYVFKGSFDKANRSCTRFAARVWIRAWIFLKP